MASSCSSELNGCATCAPGLQLFAIAATTSQGKVGFTCLDGDFDGEYYKNSNSGGGRNAFAQSSVGACYAPLIDNIIYSASSSHSYSVDRYGVIIIGVNSRVSITENLSITAGCFKPATEQNYFYYQYQSRVRGSSCEQDTERVSSNYNFIGIPGSLYCDQPPPCSLSVTCTSASSTASSSSQTDHGSSTASQSIEASISAPVNLSEIYNLCKTSVSRKMSLLKSNEPQNCNGGTCGEGKDACWGGGGCFTIADNNLDDPNAFSATAQKFKFKIATIKEGFDKTYKSISGKVKFYIPSEQDIEGSRTPCCNDDFSGTVVKEAGYSISAGSSTFKDIYLASDAGDFDNDSQSHVGETICPCTTIDSVSFI